MSRTASIARNTFLQALGRAGGTVLGILTLGVMTRYLGTAGYGMFTTATSFLQFFGILVDFGLSLTALAMLAEREEDEERVASNILTLRAVSATVFFGLAPLVVLFFPYSAEVKRGVGIAAFSFLFLAVNQVLISVLQKHLRMGRAAAAEVLGRLGLFLGAAAVAAFDLGLGWMLGALVLGNALTVAWNALLVGKLVRIRPRFDWPLWKEIVRASWPIGVSIVFNLVYLKGDVIILSLMRTQDEVGLYGAAYKILDVVTVIPIMFMGLVLPLLVRAWSDRSREDWRRILQKAFDFMSVLALPLAAGGVVLGPPLMRLFAGESFLASGPLLQILTVAAAAVFFGTLFGHAVVAVGKQKPMTWGYAADAALATVLYLALIPKYGTTAAAWITVASEAFIAGATFLMVHRVTGFVPDLRHSGKALAAAVLMAAFVAMLPEMHVLLKALFGLVAYGALSVAFGTVTPRLLREIAYVRKPEA